MASLRRALLLTAATSLFFAGCDDDSGPAADADADAGAGPADAAPADVRPTEGGADAAETEKLQLPAGYGHKLIVKPKLSGLSGITRSEKGTIYVRQGDASGGVTISTLDPVTGKLTPVITIPSGVTPAIFGGPDETCFTGVSGVVRKIKPDGTFTSWGQVKAAAAPWYYTAGGRMLGIANDGTKVLELAPDGTSKVVASGLKMAYDVVGTKDGRVYVSDLTAGQLIQVDAGGKQQVLASITPDNTDLGLGPSGELYLNNAGEGFCKVDVTTGKLTKLEAAKAPCPVVYSPADFVITDGGRALFSSWVETRISYVDLAAQDGGLLVYDDWANTSAVQVGSDHFLYVGVGGCGTAAPSRVMTFSLDGDKALFAGGLTGEVGDLALDGAGGVYIALATETSGGVYHVASKGSAPTLVAGTAGYEVGSLTVDPASGHLLAVIQQAPSTKAEATILELSKSGVVATHVVTIPKAAKKLSLRAAPSGTLYAGGAEQERFLSGPQVDRWILKVDLSTKSSSIVAQQNRVGCCPMGGFTVDFQGEIWWTLNPDALLYRIDAKGGATLFAKHLPVDSAVAARAKTGEIFLNTPGGLYKIYKTGP